MDDQAGTQADRVDEWAERLGWPLPLDRYQRWLLTEGLDALDERIHR